MNIFYLHWIPGKCARYHLDRHVVKMILETCQILCTIIWVSGKEAPLKKTHQNHPSVLWTGESKENWLWLQQLGLALCAEYTFRYEKTHKLEETIRNLEVPDLPDKKFTPPRQAMPVEYKNDDAILAYRQYYIHGKKHLHFTKKNHCWKKRKIPNFICRALGYARTQSARTQSARTQKPPNQLQLVG